MTQRLAGIRRPLQNAGLYSRVQRSLGADGVRRAFVHAHLRPQPGERILDLGCGPGDIFELLPGVEYVGVDNSGAYVAAARARYSGRARFLVADVTDLDVSTLGQFDAIIAIGVLHHLADADASAMLAAAAMALRVPGRLVTIDPAFAPGQSFLARGLISRDRGQAVRSAEGYRRLGEQCFADVRSHLRHDLARVPYTHALLECRGPKSKYSQLLHRPPA